MSNKKSSSVHVPNFTFFDEKWSQGGPKSNLKDPASAYQSETNLFQSIQESSKDASFSTNNPHLQPIYNAGKPAQQDVSKQYRSNFAPSQSSTVSAAPQVNRNKSPILKRNPTGDEFSSGKEAPLFEVHVSDIRRRMRNYHPVQLPADDGTKSLETGFQELNNKLEKGIRDGRKDEKMLLEHKMRKKQNIDELCDKLREDSNKRIYDIVQNLRIIKKQDSQFHDKIIEELKELGFLKNELIKGFDRLRQKSSIENKDKIANNLQKKLTFGCKNCCSKKSTSTNRHLTDRPHSPLLKHSRAFSHALSNTYKESEQSKEPQSARLVFGSYINDENRHKYERKMQRSTSLVKVNGFESQTSEKEDVENAPKLGRFARKYFVPLEHNRQLNQTDISQNGINKSGSMEYSHEIKMKDNFSYSHREITRKEDGKNNEISKAIGKLQNMPDRYFVRLSKSPFVYGNFMLKFTAAQMTFDVELKMNETTEIDFSNKIQNAKLLPSHCSRSPSCISQQDEEAERKNHSNSPMRSTKMNINDLVTDCDTCANKIEGMKAALQAFGDMDQKALNIDASHTENMLKLLLSDSERKKQFNSEEDTKDFLKKTCKNLGIFLESSFDIAPLHSQKIENLFKSLLFCFELRIRAYVQSQSNFLKEIEEAKLLLDEKKKIDEELALLKAEKDKISEDLKNTQRRKKDSSQKYEEQIRMLLRKLEELKGNHPKGAETQS